MICFLALYAPIAILVGYSFNAGTSIVIWEGFSFRWYIAAWQNEQIKSATTLSIVLATQASIYSTLLATLAALGTTRTRPFRGQNVAYAMINQPLMVPEIVTAVALLICFAVIKELTDHHGLIYLVLSHTAFCIPFAYLPIRRPAGRHGPDIGIGRLGPLCNTNSLLSSSHPAPFVAGNPGGCHVGIRHLPWTMW